MGGGGGALSKISLSVCDWTRSSSALQERSLPGRGVRGALLSSPLAPALLEAAVLCGSVTFPFRRWGRQGSGKASGWA